MTSTEATFHIGDTVVYAMQGTGRIKDITTRTTEGRQRDFYQIELGKNKGEVLVPCEDAAALGLRHALSASEVPQVLQLLQRAASRPTIPGGRYNPVNTGLSGLSFRKHLCNNTPLSKTIGGLLVGGDHGACCT